MNVGRAPMVLVLGDSGGLGDALIRKLEQNGTAAQALIPGTDSETTEVVLRTEWTAVAVVTRDDVLALRLTLLCAHVRPDLPLWATMFDKTIVHQLRAVVPAVHVLSPAELVAADLADRCLAVGGRRRHRWRQGVRLVDDALRLLVAAGLGLLAALAVQATISIIALHESVINALYFSTRSVATVADAPNAASASGWFKLLSALDTAAALVLIAVFTAALIRRLSRPRLTTLLGTRSAPARGHVLLVGFGQIGFRLAQELQRRGLPVAAIERAPDAPCVRLARRAGIPVAIGRGDDRGTLELLGIHRCAVVAAVTSDDLVNVAVGLAANDLVPGIPLVLRLGDGEVAAETDSLLHLGQICDAHDVAAETLAQAICALERPAATR